MDKTNHLETAANPRSTLEALGYKAREWGGVTLLAKRHTETSVIHLTINHLADGHRLDGLLISVLGGVQTQSRLNESELRSILTAGA
jgi:hypothetical protein